MPSSNKENQRIKTRSSSSISRSGRPTNVTNSSTINGASSSSLSTVATSHHNHHHHRHQPAAEHTVRPLVKTKNSKIYFSDSDDDNGPQTTTPPTTIADKNNRQFQQSLHQHQYQQQNQHDESAKFPTLAEQQHLRPTLGAAVAAAALDELNSGQSTDNDHTVNALLIISKHRRINNTSNKKNMIIHYGREFICVLALILTTYATFQNV